MVGDDVAVDAITESSYSILHSQTNVNWNKLIIVNI